jgi:hypothetical protein
MRMIGIVKLRADERILCPVPVNENMFHGRSRNRRGEALFPAKYRILSQKCLHHAADHVLWLMSDN